jgi:chemotaxis protein methyltransferase CheR
LQKRVLELFHDSLVHGGILALGSKASPQFSQIAEAYKPLSRK